MLDRAARSKKSDRRLRLKRRRGPRPFRVRREAVGISRTKALFVALFFIAGPTLAFVGSGDAAAQSTETCYVSTHNGLFSILYTYVFNQQNPVCGGTYVFADALQVTFINFLSTRTLVFQTVQPLDGSPTLYGNTTVVAVGGQASTFPVVLPSTIPQREVTACIDGGCLTFTHSTPLTLFPSNVIDVGGLDVLILGVVILTALLLFPFTLLARFIGRKALWTPAWKAWLWAPHIVAFFLFGIVVDFPLLDKAFSGSEFLFFPVVFAFMFFLWSIHLFNTARVAFAFKPNPHAFHHLSFEGWRFFIGRLPDGSYVLIGKRWRDWLARLFGHFPILVPASSEYSTQGVPYPIDLQMHTAGFRRKPGRENALDDFKVEGPLDIRWRDPPSRIYFVDHDVQINDAMPELRWHREVEVPPKLDHEGNVVIPSHTVTRRCWPYYVDPEPNAIGLAGIHVIDEIAAAVGWITYEQITRRSEEKDIQLGRLQATLYRTADEMASRRAADVVRYYEVDTAALSDEERRQDSKPILSKVVPKDSLGGEGTDERPPPVAPGKGRPKI